MKLDLSSYEKAIIQLDGALKTKAEFIFEKLPLFLKEAQGLLAELQKRNT